MNKIEIPCPNCDQTIETTREWLMDNDRVYCGTCCKAYPIAIQEEEEKQEEF